jgi:Nuclear fragile X mental retardation-interacting protein 1 (NUFIP1)
VLPGGPHRKPIPILGTNVRLDTPDEVAAWLAERKRRWPAAARVAEKKRKLEEAMANGGLHPDHLALMGGGKRFRAPSFGTEVARGRRGRGGSFGFGGGRGRGRGRVHGRSAAHGGATSSGQDLPSSRPPTVIDTELPRRPSVPSAPPTREVAPHQGSDEEDGDDDDVPEVVSAKRPPGIEAYGSSSDAELEKSKAVNGDSQPGPTIPSSLRSGSGAGRESTFAKVEPVNCSRRAPPPQPKKPPRNPFAARTSLLRNVSEQDLLHYLASPSVCADGRACLFIAFAA